MIVLPTVAVMLSCYNGEKYIEEQILSIMNQEKVEIHLFVRDDGSTDNTIKIVENIKKQYQDRIKIFCEDNIGIGNSFWKLLFLAGQGYDYYSFSDQDDLWHCDKLFQAIKKLKEESCHMYFSNQFLIDMEGKKLGRAYLTIPNYSFYSTLFANYVRGCTLVFDRYIWNLITEEGREPDRIILNSRNHDFWIACVGGMLNTLVYDEKCTMDYRQHQGNAVGAYECSLLRNLYHKIAKIRYFERLRLRSKSAASLLHCYPEYLNKDIFIELLTHQKSLLNRIKLIKFCIKSDLYGKQKKIAFILYTILGLV